MTWAKEVDYDEMYEKMRKCITSTGEKNKRYKKPSRKANVAVLLTALRNGSRISEALDSYNQFVENKEREQMARVRKRGFKFIKDEHGNRKRVAPGSECENPVERLMIIPDEIPDKLPRCKSSIKNLTTWCTKHFGVNPHSLRYAFVSWMSKQGIAPQTIARITGHATLNMILKYTETTNAHALLRTCMDRK